MKFIVDGMLGKLARWLRISGHDVVYAGDLDSADDDSLLQVAREQDRILLTSDEQLYRRGKNMGVRCALLKGEKTVEQLVELSRFTGVEVKIDFENSRCPKCNGELEEVSPEQVRDLVPEGVLSQSKAFWRCVRCGKIYWEGTHWTSIIKTAEKYERRLRNADAEGRTISSEDRSPGNRRVSSK